jgi:hypothetical protein
MRCRYAEACENLAGGGIGALNVADDDGFHADTSCVQPSVSVTTRGNSVW